MPHIETLEPGSHNMDLAEVHDLFVESAPFTAERAEIWDAFEAYVRLLAVHVPGVKLIIDGAFTQWNDEHPPVDIGFVIRAPLVGWAALPDDIRQRLRHIREGDDRLDAHFIDIDDDYVADLVRTAFEVIHDHEGRRIPGARKGVIEVEL